VGRAPPGVRGTSGEIRLHSDGLESVALAPQAADQGTLVRIVVPLFAAEEEPETLGVSAPPRVPDATTPAEEKP
jgi:hypothetical protein